ncbi:hypothetical protein E1212_27040 [Jiangella ureilytica]|uniref:Uncharacterized protein n=1 Tax=Jiangella ureilytica TaxID=2530374 RepID=A0A4R4RB95_9ACTN|nr:hypothetical protein [Jiangella ureilytica]TDC46366.1 hypothetical protein E1212_27040 [Jiangella ureilytica]
MNSTYTAQLMHEERAGRLQAEADADRLARIARRAAKSSARRSGSSGPSWVVRHLPGRHAA